MISFAYLSTYLSKIKYFLDNHFFKTDRRMIPTLKIILKNGDLEIVSPSFRFQFPSLFSTPPSISVSAFRLNFSFSFTIDFSFPPLFSLLSIFILSPRLCLCVWDKSFFNLSNVWIAAGGRNQTDPPLPAHTHTLSIKKHLWITN